MESAMKEITTNGKTILFVEVPEDAYEFRMSLKMTNHLIYRRGETFAGYVNLPNFTYQILGKSTELSEEQMKEICPKCVGIDVYPDYNYKATRLKALNFFNTVQESYLSLLEANGIVDRNPYELPESGRDKLYDSSETHGRSQVYHEEWHKRMKQYQEAQSKVKHYLALKRI